MDAGNVHEQLSLPTVAQAKAQRDAAIEQVEHGAGEWHEYAYAFVFDYLTRHATLYADDLWAAGLTPPREPRALGAVLRAASLRGLMRDSGTFRASTRRHMTPGRVWVSLIHYRDNGEHPEPNTGRHFKRGRQ